MAIDDLIEQLAFGTTTAKSAHCLGLYLSPEVIYVAETRLDKGRIAVDHLVRIPVPQPDASKTAGATGTLNTDFLNDNVKLADLMRQSMSQIKWGTKDVVVTLSHHLGLIRYFAMPGIDRRFWKSAVPLEAKKYIPIPFELLTHDFQVDALAPDANGKQRQGALIAVTQKKNLSNVAALLQALGLKLIAMEAAPCSVLRVWETLDGETRGLPHGQIHFDGGNIRILLADKGLPVFFRELFLGPQASLNDLRKIDLSGCIGFSQKALAAEPLKRLRVSGVAAGLPQWAEAFSQEAGVKAEVQDTAALLGIRAGDWGGYAAIGASARCASPTAVTLDLARVGKVTDEEKRVARDIAFLSGAVAGLIGLFGLVQQGQYLLKAGELSGYRRDPQMEAVFAGKTNDQIENMLRKMEQQAEDGEAATGAASPKMVSLLKEIADSLPEKAWLTHLEIEKPMVLTPQVGCQLHLSGGAAGSSVSEEQAMAYQIREALFKKALVARLFPQIEISVGAKTRPEDAGAKGLDPDALAKRLENRTSFEILGGPKR